jgi:hypothetical protein
MAKWADTTLSTRDSVKRIESEMASTDFITNEQLTDKIALAKILIGDMLELYLTDELNLVADEADDEVLLDFINNPSVFGLASDYLVNSKQFEDISLNSLNEVVANKSTRYYNMFIQQLESAKKRINLDTDQDGDVDEYRASHVGYLIR